MVRVDDDVWRDLDPSPEGVVRSLADVTTAAGLEQTRARFWRYPPGAYGRPHNHAENGQEEVFVVLEGTLTMLLDGGAERVELPPQSVIKVDPETERQLRNDGAVDVVLYAYNRA